MKKLLLPVCLVLTSFIGRSQDLIPGYEFAETGTIYITEKDSVQGVVAFTYIKNNEVRLMGKKEIKYKTGDIIGFHLNDSKLDFIPGKYGLGFSGFLQKLNPENKKSNVVKTFSFTKGSKIEPGKEPEGGWIASLYLTSKNVNYEATKKIGEALKDECPVLSAKILAKEKGYSLAFLSTKEEAIEVYTTLSNEIEAGCK